jgi:hypothetical protein
MTKIFIGVYPTIAETTWQTTGQTTGQPTGQVETELIKQAEPREPRIDQFGQACSGKQY